MFQPVSNSTRHLVTTYGIMGETYRVRLRGLNVKIAGLLEKRPKVDAQRRGLPWSWSSLWCWFLWKKRVFCNTFSLTRAVSQFLRCLSCNNDHHNGISSLTIFKFFIIIMILILTNCKSSSSTRSLPSPGSEEASSLRVPPGLNTFSINVMMMVNDPLMMVNNNMSKKKIIRGRSYRVIFSYASSSTLYPRQ